MKHRPLPVIIVSILFVVVGCVGFIYHLQELSNPDNLTETVVILLLRILAVVCGILLWLGIGWARWLTIAWLVYHVVIGALNSTTQMLAHIAFLIVVSILLFVPVAAKYFTNRSKG